MSLRLTGQESTPALTSIRPARYVEPPEPRRSSRLAPYAWPGVIGIALVAGSAIVTYAYSYAARHGNENLHFHIFWLGVLLFVVPAFARLCWSGVHRAERLAILCATALFFSLPNYLLDPTSPVGFDDLAHWHQSELLYLTGKLFQPNRLVRMAQFYPGLHIVTADLRFFSGIPTFPISLLLIALLHVAALIGVFMLVERLTHSEYVAALAAFIYSLNPGFMYFDSAYTYESLAIVFFIWVIVAVVHFQAPGQDRALRAAWFAAGLIFAAACIVTHHLSSYITLFLCLVIAVVTAGRALRGIDSRRIALMTGVFTLLVAAGILAWLVFVAPTTLTYLFGPMLRSASDIVRILHHKEAAHGVFQGAKTPLYERLSAFVAVAIAGVGALAGLWTLRRQGPRYSAAYALAFFGLLFFVSFPFKFAPHGGEATHRSWHYSYLGISFLVALAIPYLFRQAPVRRRRVIVAGLTVLMSIVTVGNVAMDNTGEGRFPGPYIYGSDTRTLDNESLGTAAWFKEHFGENQKILADHFIGQPFYAFANEVLVYPVRSLPVWHLFFDTGNPTPHLIHDLKHSNYRYLIIDKRMAGHISPIGYFDPDEPSALLHEAAPAAALNKYERLPWAIKVYASSHIEIYRLYYRAFGLEWRPSRTRHP